MKSLNFKKVIYIFLVAVSFFTIIYLVIKPIKTGVYEMLYNIDSKTYKKEFDVVENKFYVDKKTTSSLTFYCDPDDSFQNLHVIIKDSSLNVIHEETIISHQGMVLNILFYPPYENEYYTLILKSEDNEKISFLVTKSDDIKHNYLVNDENYSLKLILTYDKENYFFFWYPLFLLAFLYLIYPFVFERKIKNEK